VTALLGSDGCETLNRAERATGLAEARRQRRLSKAGAPGRIAREGGGVDA
jgi:hypothetical protein